MQVTYKGHIGSDLEVVNAARVSFSSESELGCGHCGSHKIKTEGTWSSCVCLECGLDTEDIEDRRLSNKDQHLIKFLARGCTTKDWEGIIGDAAYLGYETKVTQEYEELKELLNHVKRMPSHWVPFANGGQVKMHFKVPLFVARQLQKHTAGFNPWSEVSRRYVDSDPEFYVPDVWRGRSADKKQGSTGEITSSCVYDAGGELTHPKFAAADINELALHTYKSMVTAGVAPEQARMVLPQAMYTEFVWSGNLYAWASLYNTRSWGDSQAETANVAQQIKAIVEPLFPVSWSELTQ